MAETGHRLPSGVAQIAAVIGHKAALELAFWRWWRRVVTTPPGNRPPRSVSIYIPKHQPAPDHALVRDLGEDAARELVTMLGGETFDCYIERWLAEACLIRRVTAEMGREVLQGSTPNSAAQRAAARYGWKDRTAWLRIYDAPPRWSPLDELPWYVEHELRALFDARLRRLATTMNGVQICGGQ